MPRHELTKEERSRGAHGKAAKLRAAKAEAERKADEAFDAMLAQALLKHASLFDSEDETVVMRAVRELYDRRLGRPKQRTELSGAVNVNVDARSKLADALAGRSARKGAT